MRLEAAANIRFSSICAAAQEGARDAAKDEAPDDLARSASGEKEALRVSAEEDAARAARGCTMDCCLSSMLLMVLHWASVYQTARSPQRNRAATPS